MDTLLRVVEIAVQLAALVVAAVALWKVKKLHVDVDGRLTELLKTTGSEQRALGDAEGVERERTRKDG